MLNEKKIMFADESSTASGQVEPLNRGSCVEARQRPLEDGRKSNMFKKMISFAVVAGLVLALAPAAQAGTISAGDPLIAGSGLSVGDTFHLVFVTSVNRTFPTKEEDLNVYNQFVDDVATNAGAYTGSIVAAYDWSWKAIGSVQAGFPIPSPYHHAYNNAVVSAPVYNLNAELVATGYADIWDGSLANPIKYTEQGTAAAIDVKVNTGTRYYGSQDSASHAEYSLCGDQGTRTGDPHATDSTWIYGWLSPTDHYAPDGPLYGLSEPLEVVPEPATLALLALGGLGMLMGRRRHRV